MAIHSNEMSVLKFRGVWIIQYKRQKLQHGYLALVSWNYLYNTLESFEDCRQKLKFSFKVWQIYHLQGSISDVTRFAGTSKIPVFYQLHSLICLWQPPHWDVAPSITNHFFNPISLATVCRTNNKNQLEQRFIFSLHSI